MLFYSIFSCLLYYLIPKLIEMGNELTHLTKLDQYFKENRENILKN